MHGTLLCFSEKHGENVSVGGEGKFTLELTKAKESCHNENITSSQEGYIRYLCAVVWGGGCLEKM